MSVAVIFDPSYLNQVKNVLSSQSASQYAGRTDVLIVDNQYSPGSEQSVLTFISGKEFKYLKVSSGTVSDMTTGEKNQVDADEAIALLASIRNGAKAGKDGFNSNALLIRAILDVVKDEINTLRILPLIGLASKTLTQFRTAIDSKVNGGTLDEGP